MSVTKKEELHHAMMQLFFQDDEDAYTGYCESENEQWLNELRADPFIRKVQDLCCTAMHQVLNTFVEFIINWKS